MDFDRLRRLGKQLFCCMTDGNRFAVAFVCRQNDGSDMTMPRPSTNTCVVQVPKSIPIFFVNGENIDPMSFPFAAHPMGMCYISLLQSSIYFIKNPVYEPVSYRKKRPGIFRAAYLPLSPIICYNEANNLFFVRSASDLIFSISRVVNSLWRNKILPLTRTVSTSMLLAA